MASNCFWLSWWRLMGCGGFATGTVVGKMIKFVCRKVEVWLLQTSLIKVLRTQWEKRETNKIKSNKSKRRHRSTVGIMAGHDSELCLLNWIVLWEAIFFFFQQWVAFSLFSLRIHIQSSVLSPCFHRFRTSHLGFVSLFNVPRGKAEIEAVLPGNIGI